MPASVDISSTQNKHVTASKPLNAELITDLVVCVCVWLSDRERLVCRGSAVTSHGPSSATSDGTSIRSSFMTSPCSPRPVASPGPTWSGLLRWPRASSHSWMVRANSVLCMQRPCRWRSASPGGHDHTPLKRPTERVLCFLRLKKSFIYQWC